MKKYTVIYADTFQMGSHRNSITKMKHIECIPEKLKEEVENNDIDFSNVWFILDGHCEKTKD